MKRLLVLAMLAMSLSAIAQSTSYTVSKDQGDGALIYNGRVTFNDLDNESTFTWLKAGREKYQPNEEKMNYLKAHLKDYSMTVFIGTWCDDSHDLAPKLEKVLQLAGYPADKLTMYATDRTKKTNDGAQKKYHITLVPTVILYSNGKEIGRITETVKKTIEADLANIIQKDQRGQPAH